MKVICEVLQITPGLIEPFKAAMVELARDSVKEEPGCLRFDVFHDDNDPDRIINYLVFRDEAAWQAHRQGPLILRWRETMLRIQQDVRDWFAQKALVYHCTSVFPTDADWK